MQLDKEFRWDYDYVEMGDPQETGYYIVDTREEFTLQSDSDDWANGSSSSYSISGRNSAGARSPVDELQSLGDGDIVGSDIGPTR